MKKILLGIFAITLVSLTVISQNIIILDHSGNDIGGTTLIKEGVNTESVVSLELDIKNNSASSMDIKVRKTEIEITPGHDNFFCLGQCYPPSVFESPSITIDAGVTLPGSAGFSCDVEPNGNGGITRMAYTFFDADNESDSVQVFVDFQISPYSNSIIENISGNFISEAFPNPATNFVNFNYGYLPTSNASVRIHNLLGSEIMLIGLSNSDNRVTIPVNDLMKGIYFWSFIVDEKVIKTERLIIN